jgi:hypothetical protein
MSMSVASPEGSAMDGSSPSAREVTTSATTDQVQIVSSPNLTYTTPEPAAGEIYQVTPHAPTGR